MKNYYRLFGICLLLISLTSVFYSQEMDATQINQKITQIRRSTNWDDAASAKKANEEIKRLSRQLMLVKQNVNKKNPGKVDEIKEQNITAREQVWGQMMKAFKEGKEGDLLLGTPVREEIVEEYKNDDLPIIKNQEVLEEQTLLVIDMSQKLVQRLIDQMENLKSIKTLVITGGKHGVPVNLSDILNRAGEFPLEELYIINFNQFVKTIPKEIGTFTKLQVVSFVGNQLTNLPKELNALTGLRVLYADMNPITTILPFIKNQVNLEEVGVAKTKIPNNELTQISKLFPNCKILIK